LHNITKKENKIKYKIQTKNLRNKNTENDNTNKWTTFTYINNPIKNLTKLFENTNIKTAFETNKILLNIINTTHKINDTLKTGIYKIECTDCNKCYVGQTKKQLKKRYSEHLNAYKKPNIYKSNLATHAINNGHEFPNINNMTLLKNISYKGNIMNIWENLHIYKHKTNNKLIEEQIQTNTKHDTMFKTLNIEDTFRTQQKQQNNSDGTGTSKNNRYSTRTSTANRLKMGTQSD